MLFQPGKLGAAGQLAGVLRRVKTQHVHGLPDGDLGGIRLTGGRDRQTAVPHPAFIGQRHVQLTALRRAENAQAQIGMAGAAALRGQMAGDGGGVFLRLLQQAAGQLQLPPDVGVIVGGAVTAGRPVNGGKLLPEQTAGAPLRRGQREGMLRQAVGDDLRQLPVADAVQVDTEGLLHMRDGLLQVGIRFGLIRAGGLQIDLVIAAAVAAADLQVGVLVQTVHLLPDRELVQLQHPHHAVADGGAGQLSQQGTHFGGVKGGEFAGQGRQHQQKLPPRGDGVALHHSLRIGQQRGPGGEGGKIGKLLVGETQPQTGGALLQLFLQGGIGGNGALQPAGDHPQGGGDRRRLRREQQQDGFALRHAFPQGGKQAGSLRAADGIAEFRRKGGGFLF